MKGFPRYFPIIIALCVLAFMGSAIGRSFNAGDRARGISLEEIERIPVSAGGRTKPLDTFARNTLVRLSGRQTYEVDGVRRPATEWILEAWADPSASATRQVFRIDHPDVKSIIGVTDTTRTRFSWKEMEPKLDEIVRQAELAQQVGRKQQDPFQRAVSDLYGKLAEYAEIRALRTPYVVAPLATGEEWAPLVAPDPSERGKTVVSDTESSRLFQAILVTYSTGDAAGCEKAVAAYTARLNASLAPDMQKGAFEVVFSRLEPFYQASTLYMLAFLLGCLGLLSAPISPERWKPSFFRAAVAVIAVAFAIQTFGLVARVYLQGRPPVTNLYSSAVFIGWACVPLALLGEWFSRVGILSIAASFIGFATLIVAHNLSASGDTMEMMQAVLDTNFWLATHVVIVTIGYSATFLAGFIAIFYVVGGACTRLLAGDAMKALPKMIYGVICFAALASFVGTVLGGIWADQSWGRFWGWDPKENGAAMIVAWNLIILHARWGGMIRERGVAALAIAGNVITAWSWFGTNMLGVGLHSYGFMDSAVFVLTAFCVSQLLLMAVAFIPTAKWKSLQTA